MCHFLYCTLFILLFFCSLFLSHVYSSCKFMLQLRLILFECSILVMYHFLYLVYIIVLVMFTEDVGVGSDEA